MLRVGDATPDPNRTDFEDYPKSLWGSQSWRQSWLQPAPQPKKAAAHRLTLTVNNYP
jgi:hypothetical protein